jgi:hypothetical protein
MSQAEHEGARTPLRELATKWRELSARLTSSPVEIERNEERAEAFDDAAEELESALAKGPGEAERLLCARITNYLQCGGLWNPESMEHDKVRTLLMDCREVLAGAQVPPATRYLLNPDFRRDAPKDKPYCARCQKEIKDPSKAVRVTADWDTWQVIEGGRELVGADCWKVISATQVPPATPAPSLYDDSCEPNYPKPPKFDEPAAATQPQEDYTHPENFVDDSRTLAQPQEGPLARQVIEDWIKGGAAEQEDTIALERGIADALLAVRKETIERCCDWLEGNAANLDEFNIHEKCEQQATLRIAIPGLRALASAHTGEGQ